MPVVGTAYLKADQNYLYAAFDITGWTTAPNMMNGNLLGIGAWTVNGQAGSIPGVQFQEATAAANWGGGGSSGSIDGEVGAWRTGPTGSTLQGSLPADLLSATSFATGNRVWEAQVPISSLGLSAGSTLYVVGGINFGGVTYWYPNQAGLFGPPGNYAAITVEAAAPVPEPTTMIAGALLLLPFGASALRRMRKNRAA